MKINEAMEQMAEIRAHAEDEPLKDNVEITEVIGLVVLGAEMTLTRIEAAEARIKNLEKTMDGVLLVLVKMLTPEREEG